TKKGTFRGRSYSHEETGTETSPVLPDRRHRPPPAARRPSSGRAGHVRSDEGRQGRPRDVAAGTDQALDEQGRAAVGALPGAVQEIHEARRGSGQQTGRAASRGDDCLALAPTPRVGTQVR